MNTAILTIQSINYGNRLQNYALQSILEKNGSFAETVRRNAGFRGSFATKLRTLKSRVGAIKHINDRINKFRRFDRLIHFSDQIVAADYISPGVGGSYDMFVVGSDQVWNPDFDFNSELEYLPFVPKSKKIAYAASFGVSEIASNRERTAELLDGFSAISVREDAGAKIVRDLSGVESPVVLDPTLLLSAGDWNQVAVEPKIADIERPYLLKYVLGDDVHGAEIDGLARKMGLSVVDLKDEGLPVGPAEFVWLIEHAQLVCIDSFHGSVFSLIFHRPFIIFERQSDDADMSSRFDTLCRIFGMDHHRKASPSFDLARCLDEDWDSFERRLARERARSLEWLGGALARVGGR